MTQPPIMQLLTQAQDHLRHHRLREAQALCQAVLQQDAQNACALSYLGTIASRVQDHRAAVELAQRAVALDPGVAEYHYNLGSALLTVGRPAEAERALREALRLNPRLSPALLNIGAALMNRGRTREAMGVFEEAIRQDVSSMPARMNLARALRQEGQLDAAIAQFREILRLHPQFPEAYSAMGSCLREAGQIESAVEAFRRAIALRPDYREAHSNLVYALHYLPGIPAEEVFAEHLRWARHFEDPVKPRRLAHQNDRDLDRRLRIGYCAESFHHHIMGIFIEPVLENHDHSRFEIFCYSDVEREDDVTARLRRHADVWRPTRHLKDDALAGLIRQDGIDVLVDLTLHMRRSRLVMFAHKPAPVQATHLAYPATSGLEAMDYALSDALLDPPGQTEQFYTETLARLPQCYWCYKEPEGAPDVAPTPAIGNDHVTFGCLNSFAKVNRQVIQLWARVLAATPGAKLAVVIAGGASENASAIQRFSAEGIDPGRLLIFARQARREDYLALYSQIDIALDPFPYGGHATSLDTCFMGVPIVSLVGRTAVSRAALTILTNLGRPQTLANSHDDYVRIATELASDVPKLANLRATLRPAMRQSVLMDAPLYTRRIEDAYRQMWRSWCGTGEARQAIV